MEIHSNALITESSPYLLQHAHNPVNWVPWSDDIFEQAKAQNKLVLISVGYSACHWCHVMEHESFEDEEVAALMNKFFINVKVDREERPDVDNLFMTAVQLMTNRGGWPLNCFTLPDGRPIYGGTYFPKEQWMHILRSLEHVFRNDREKTEEYAAELMNGIASSELVSVSNEEQSFTNEHVHELVLRWKRSFDLREGGNNRAPKFPLPNNLDFLLQYAWRFDDEIVFKHVELSLDKMALGGIYDQVGGGFARYSVDVLWKVPHFEKMLYDNGQLLSTYARAFTQFKKPLYKRICFGIVSWLEREMLDKSGAFCAALDADSEGIEGKYYIWTKQELEELDKETNGFCSQVYEVSNRSYWEEEQAFILLRTKDDRELSKELNLSLEDLDNKIHELNETIHSMRKTRVYPGKDDKCLSSWNAMTLKGLCEAYRVFEDESMRALALKNYKWLKTHMLSDSGKMWRTFKNGETKINGFLEDYAFTIEALIVFYQMDGETEALELADQLMQHCLKAFLDKESKMFFLADEDSKLLVRKMEVNDNVMPSGNSTMALNLFNLGRLLRKEEYRKHAEQMLANVYDGMEHYGSGYSNWAILLDACVNGSFDVVCTGPAAKEKAFDLAKSYLPTALIVYPKGEKLAPVFDTHDRTREQISACKEQLCFSSSDNVEEVYREVMNNKL